MRAASSSGALGRRAPEVASVYVHAPFCARRCFYCDFAVTVARSVDPAPWAAAVETELGVVQAEGWARLAPSLETVYVGGGTPSLLGPDAMDLLADALGRGRLEGSSLEWTAEANPESLTAQVAARWRDAGVNRLSLGVQSFQPSVLRWMGRLHGAEEACRGVEIARSAGLRNLSLDLIFGVPDTVPRDWGADLEAAVALAVPHVSLYGLTAEPGTPLGGQVEEGRVRMPDEDRYRDEYLLAHDRLTRAGYHHYEVSNFALPGHESRHNSAYWSGAPFLGLGNGAHSLVAGHRWWNLRDWDAYRDRTRAGVSPVEERERLGRSQEALERIWLGLRCTRGLPLTLLSAGPAGDLVAQWIARGLARSTGTQLTLTAEGWLILDELSVSLSRALERGAALG